MGTTSSSTSSGSGVISLSRGTKVQAYLAAPQEVSTVAIIVICDSDSTFFDAPEMRRVVDYMSLSSGAMVISLDMLMSSASPEATSADKIEVMFYCTKLFFLCKNKQIVFICFFLKFHSSNFIYRMLFLIYQLEVQYHFQYVVSVTVPR